MAIAALTKPRGKRLWTYDEVLKELPETNQPVELWDGELIVSPSPHPKHQRIVLRLCERLNGFVKSRKLGEVFISLLDVVLSQRRVVQPDIIFVSNARQSIVQDRIRGVPDLAVEVISEGSWYRDRMAKKTLYEQFGLPEYWILDPETRRIEVFTLLKGAYQLHSGAVDAQAAKSKVLSPFKVSFRDLES